MNKFVKLANGVNLPSIGLGSYESGHLIRRAFEIGYRQLDCAPLYRNQAEIGVHIESAISENVMKRDELFVTSKLPMNGMRPEKVEYFLRKSLKELRVDYVDLFLIHAPFAIKHVADDVFYPVDESTEMLLSDEELDFCDTWKASLLTFKINTMEQMVQLGLAKSIGLSNFNEQQISRILQIATIKPTVLQIELHAYFQQRKMVKFCKENGITVQAFASLGSPQTAAEHKNSILINDPIVKQIAEKYKKTVAQVLLRWLTQNGIAAIPRSLDELQLKENFDVFDFQLTEEDNELIRSLDKDERIYWFEYAKGVKEHREYPF